MISSALRVAILFSVFASSLGWTVVQTNDDGWAVANIRAHYSAFEAAGFDIVLSAPAENESGTGSSDAAPTTVGSSGCEFNSCPAGSPPMGSDPDNARLNYVNSFPVTSVRYGCETVAPTFFDGNEPDIVVSGPNVGNNLGSTVLISGTVGAAVEAASEGIPAIAFSGNGGSQVSYTTLSDSTLSSTTTANVFAALGVEFTNALLSSSTTPILPSMVVLNVNYAAASGDCADADSFEFVLSRINAASSGDAADVETCGTDRLPTETSVVNRSGCFASVSVMNASTKGDVDASTQAFVLDKLSDFLSC